MYCVLGWMTGSVLCPGMAGRYVLCTGLEDRVCTVSWVGGQGMYCVLVWRTGYVMCPGLEDRVCTVS